MQLTDPVHSVGIDIDRITPNPQVWASFKKSVEQRIKRLCYAWGGYISESYKTKSGGHHYRISFGFRIPTLLESFEMRHYCYDDNNRLVMDILRNLSGAELTDTLFDKKVRKKLKILVSTGKRLNTK